MGGRDDRLCDSVCAHNYTTSPGWIVLCILFESLNIELHRLEACLTTCTMVSHNYVCTAGRDYCEKQERGRGQPHPVIKLTYVVLVIISSYCIY